MREFDHEPFLGNIMSILATCSCGKKVQAKDELAGKKVKCPQCGEPLQIPAAGGVASPAKPTAAKPAAKPAARPAAPQTQLDPLAANDPFGSLGSLQNAGGFGSPLGGPGMNPLLGNQLGGNPMMGGGAYRQQYEGGSRGNSNLVMFLGIGGGVAALIIVVAFVALAFMRGGDSQTVAVNAPPSPAAPAQATPAPKPAEAPAATPAVETPPANNANNEGMVVKQPKTFPANPPPPQAETPAAEPEPAAAPESESGNAATGGTPADSNADSAPGPARGGKIGADGRPLGSGAGAAAGQPKTPSLRGKEGVMATVQGKATSWKDLGKAYQTRIAKPEPFKGAILGGKKDEGLILKYSWMFDILPHIGHQDLHDKFDRTKGWNTEVNLQLTAFVIPAFLNPQDTRKSFHGQMFAGMGVTHFVGMSGIEDSRNDVAASWPRSDPRAGVFGYDGIAKPNEIADGTSSTIAIIGSGEMMAPWIMAGGSTVRGAREPFFDEITGFGSKGVSQEGVQASFADGSVRVLSKNISPKVFRAMCTIHGSEAVDLKEVDTATIK